MVTAKKSASKRKTLKHKFSIKAKVSEHHKKQKRDAKKNPQWKSKVKKDPGIPKNLPFKDKILHQIELTKKRNEEDRLKRKEQRMADASDPDDLSSLLTNAAMRSDAYEASLSLSSSPTTSTPLENSKRAYYKEFKKVVEAADVILEVLDARDPLGCRTKQIEELIVNSGAHKRVILVLNKIDLVPRPVVEAWLKYLRNELPTVAFKASTQSQRDHLGHANVPTNAASTNLLTSKECLGADTLIQLLKNYSRNHKLKTSITVGVIGFPNVGKSSLINSLKRSKVCGVGSTPGLTKSTQEIHLDKNIKLLDCPGIVFSTSAKGQNDADVILRNCVKVELLDDPVMPVEYILSRSRIEQIMEIYSIPAFKDTKEFLISVARQRGKLKKGGVPDIPNAARAVLQDWNSGRIPYYCVPPSGEERHISSEVVGKWSEEFKVAGVGDGEVLEGSGSGTGKMVEITGGGVVEIDWERVDEEGSDEEEYSEDSEEEDSDEDEEMESDDE